VDEKIKNGNDICAAGEKFFLSFFSKKMRKNVFFLEEKMCFFGAGNVFFPKIFSFSDMCFFEKQSW
jgi:hypothetical protein